MPFTVKDRVRETSVTNGVGEYTLAGAPVGFQAFSAIGANNTCPYFATDNVNWEVGIGTVLAGPARLQRTAILASSNGGAAVNWGVGTREIICGMPATFGFPRVVTKSVAGGVDVVLSEAEQRCDTLILTGALTANINVVVSDTPWQWIVFNNTSGAFVPTLKTAAGTGKAVAQGKRMILYSDGVNVDFQAGTMAMQDASNVAISGGTAALSSNGLSVGAGELSMSGGSVALGGTPTAPTASLSTSTAQIATTAFVMGQVANQADQEAASDVGKFVTSGRQVFSPSANKAHVNFNGTGVVAIRRGFNVSSITDNGNGDWTINFTSAFSGTDYSAEFGGGITAGSGQPCFQITSQTTTACSIQCVGRSSGALEDDAIVCANFQGDR